MSRQPQNPNLDDAAFEVLVDTYGSDLRRWPAERAAAAEHLLAMSPEAKRLLAEGRALDRMLATAPATGALGTADLLDRIVNLAAADAPAAATQSQTNRPMAPIIRLDEVMPKRPARTRPRDAGPEPLRPSPVPLQTHGAVPFRPTTWLAGAALAASLVLGVGLGMTGTITSPLDALAAVAGLELGDPSVLAMASAEALEDLL